MSTIPLLTPKTNAAKQYIRHLAEESMTNSVLARVVLLLAAGLIGMSVYTVWLSRRIIAEKPIVVRVDKVGRAEAVNIKWDEYRPQDSDMKYFLIQFVAGFYARNHHTVQDIYPAVLHYLRADLFHSINTTDRKTQWMAKFLNSPDPDISVNVTNVSLDRGMEPSFKAQIDAVKIVSGAGGSEQKSTPFVVTVWFHVKPELVKNDPDLINYNPLGFLIDSFRSDDAFGADNRNNN